MKIITILFSLWLHTKFTSSDNQMKVPKSAKERQLGNSPNCSAHLNGEASESDIQLLQRERERESVCVCVRAHMYMHVSEGYLGCQCTAQDEKGRAWFCVSCTQTLGNKQMHHTRVQSLGQEYPLEKEMATHSSALAWEIPWAEEPGGL